VDVAAAFSFSFSDSLSSINNFFFCLFFSQEEYGMRSVKAIKSGQDSSGEALRWDPSY